MYCVLHSYIKLMPKIVYLDHNILIYSHIILGMPVTPYLYEYIILLPMCYVD